MRGFVISFFVLCISAPSATDAFCPAGVFRMGKNYHHQVQNAINVNVNVNVNVKSSPNNGSDGLRAEQRRTRKRLTPTAMVAATTRGDAIKIFGAAVVSTVTLNISPSVAATRSKEELVSPVEC